MMWYVHPWWFWGSKKNGIKLEHQYDQKTWRTQVKYQFVTTGEKEIHQSHGLDF